MQTNANANVVSIMRTNSNAYAEADVQPDATSYVLSNGNLCPNDDSIERAHIKSQWVTDTSSFPCPDMRSFMFPDAVSFGCADTSTNWSPYHVSFLYSKPIPNSPSDSDAMPNSAQTMHYPPPHAIAINFSHGSTNSSAMSCVREGDPRRHRSTVECS
jgi:hypothetical protein